MAAASCIFEEDEVSLCTPNGVLCGLVLESAEYFSSDDEEDNENGFFESLKKGTIRVAWHPDGKEEVIPEKKVKLTDRSLMPGDVVRRLIEGQESQRGYVTSTKVRCHLQVLGRNRVICDVDSSCLEPLKYWDTEPGDVYLDSWVGKVENITERVVLKFSDGARCVVDDHKIFDQLCMFEDVTESRERDSEFCMNEFYAGQQLSGCLRSLDGAHWLKTTKKHSPQTAKKAGIKEVKVTVEAVEPKSISVHWLCQGYTMNAPGEEISAKMSSPPVKLTQEHIKRLKKLDCFEASSTQIGDKAFYTVGASDKIFSILPKGTHSLVSYILKHQSGQGAPGSSSDQTKMDEEMNLKNKQTKEEEEEETEEEEEEEEEGEEEEVQEGPKEELTNAEEADDEGEGYSSDESSHHSGEEAAACGGHRKKKTVRKHHVSGNLQLRRMNKKRRQRLLRKKTGRMEPHLGGVGERLPVEVIYTTSVADVMWQDGSMEQNIPSTELFPIHHLDELEFFPGDYVTPASSGDGSVDDVYGVIESVDHAGRTCLVHWMKASSVDSQTNKGSSPTHVSTEELSVYDIKDHPDYKFRPGHVVVRVAAGPDDPDVIDVSTPRNQSCTAAGQVLSLGTDGRLKIQWADGSTSFCYPQELYLLSDELSDVNDSEFDSDSDSTSSGEESENSSWETESVQSENSQEGESGSESAPAEAAKSDEASVVPLDSSEVEGHLTFIRFSLNKLEEILQQSDQLEPPLVIHCYKEILHAHKACLKLDRLLSTKYFTEEPLVDAMASIRSELKMEKTVRVAKQVLSMCLSSYNAQLKNLDERLKKLEEGGQGDGEQEAQGQDSVAPKHCEGAEGGKPAEESSKLNEQFETEAETLVRCQKAWDLCQLACALLKEPLLTVAKNHCEEVPQEENKEAPHGAEEVTPPRPRPNLELSVTRCTEVTSPAAEDSVEALLQTPVTPQTPAEIRAKLQLNFDGFQMMEEVPASHKFKNSAHDQITSKAFMTAIRKELKLLQSSLPKGIIVRGFEDRMDLFSVMIEGPEHTPYEDGLFIFDVQLGSDYPNSPPNVHYVAYCTDRLNPNLYESGKVCVSLLGTWTGKGTEVWSSKSSLLQVIISIQGLILVSEPYYNEAGYEKQRGSQQAIENSRMYNEMAILKMVQSMAKMALQSHEVFTKEIESHLRSHGPRMYRRLSHWLHILPSTSEASASAPVQGSPSCGPSANPDSSLPDFPLLPLSKGFQLSLAKGLEQLKNNLTSKKLMETDDL